MAEVTEVIGTKDVLQPQRGGDFLPEDIFPPVDISKIERKLVEQFNRDLKLCVEEVNGHIPDWEEWRILYRMQESHQMYPDISTANFASGLLCEKMNEFMDRMKRSIYMSTPIYSVNMTASNIEDIDQVQRLEAFFHHIFHNVLKIRKSLGNEALFDFGLDGSLIVEPDVFFKIIPNRTIKTYTNESALEEDADKIMDPTMLDDLHARIAQGVPARAVVEEKYDENQGLQLGLVPKIDHLIPPGVYRDKDLRFRARRLYMTKSDLEVMASPAVNWYEKEDVEKVLGFREIGIRAKLDNEEIHGYDRMRPEGSHSSWIGFNWDSVSTYVGRPDAFTSLPYKDLYPVYRIMFKYGYSTVEDPDGLIPKWVVCDYEFDSETILRARVYPHLHNLLPWIHFKLGFCPDSYYGYGMGALLSDEDVRQTNILNLFMDGAAMASFPPYVCKHPEEGGITPFSMGMAPGMTGWVRNIGDFQSLAIPTPPESLVSRLYPISDKNAESRSSITSYAMGQEASSDPRSPARKTELLLGQAQIGMDSMIGDFNLGLDDLAILVQKALHEVALIRGTENLIDTPLKNIVSGDPTELGTNQVILSELGLDIVWESGASSLAINPEYRKAAFLRQFSFFAPLLQNLAPQEGMPPELAAERAQLYMKYFHRWMVQAARELELRNMEWLIPAAEELNLEGVQQALTGMQEMLKVGEAVPPPQPAERPEREMVT